MAPRSFRFASFTLDLDRLRLSAPSGEVKLRPKSFEVLRYLLENARRVVTKEEVIAKVWSGVTVTEESLTRCISEVRQALGDASLQILQTVPKRGYLLDVPVERSDFPETPVAREGGDLAANAAPAQPHQDPPAAPARPTDPERRQVTVLVCTIVDLKALAASLDLEVFREVVASYEKCISEVVAHHGGFVAPHLAEGVQAYFGYPAAREDDAERAVRAGLAATRAVGALSVKCLAKGLQARVGIATGLVLIGDATDSNGRPPGLTLVGETPLLAAHLATVAAPGTVVMSGATRRIVGRLFACRDLGAPELGGADPVDASVVLHEDAVPSRFEALRGANASPLVGREEELALLLRRWEQAKAGNGRVVLLTGDAGIGKSRIALALRSRLAGDPHILQTYHCSPYHQNTALHPIITQFNRAAGIRRNDSPEVKLRKLEAALAYSGDWPAEHVGLFAALLSIPGGERYPLPDLEPQQLRERTLSALFDTTRRLCAIQPMLAVFEDLHWIDPTSLEQLSRAVEEIPGLPLLLVATARPEFTPPWPNHWHTSTLPLARLGPPDIEALIGGLTQGKSLPPQVVAEIAARTDGVPLYIEEVTKSVIESGMVQEAGNRYELTGPLRVRDIPSTLYASLSARLDRVPSAKQVAQIGATIGVEFSYAVIAAVSALPEPDLKAGLAQLVAAELIFQRGTPPEATYRFKHTLVRDAAYDSLFRNRRQVLHGQIARTLEAQFASLAATAPGTLAHHYEEAGVLDKAAMYLWRAARRSLERSATAEANAQLQRALGLLAGLPETVERKKQEVELRLTMFQAYLTLGEIERMTDTLKAAVDLAKAIGDERKLAFATAQLATAQWMRGEHPAAIQNARLVLDYAERAEKLDPAQRAETLPLQIFGKCTLANAHHGEGRIHEAIALHREIIDVLAGLHLESQRLGWAGLPSVMSRAFLSWFLVEVGEFDAASAQIERGCAVADAAQQPYSQVLIHAAEGLYHVRRGYPELAVPILEPALKLCQHVLTMEAIVAGWLGTALVQVGRPAEALAVTEDAFRRGAHLAGGRYTWFYLFKAIGEAHAALGHAAEALAWADKAIGVTEEARERLHYAQGLKCRGDMRLALSPSIEEATGDLESARQIAVEYGLQPLVAECDLALAQTCGLAGRHEEAGRLAARAAKAFRVLGLERHLAEAEKLAT